MNRYPFPFLLVALSIGMLVQASPATPGAETTPPAETALSLDDPDSAAVRAFQRVIDRARAERLHERPFGDIMQRVGLYFRGVPYVAGMLDEPDEERLVVAFDGYDCVTFVETVLALARGIAVRDYTYPTFAEHLRDQRYRDGVLDGYCSRLHYFSEWIANNEVRGTVDDVTRALGGVRLQKQLTFMSTHRNSYARLVESDSLFRGIQQMEARLADLPLYHVPQSQIRAVYDQLEPGDILAFTTSIEGLDVSHTGLVYAHEDGSKGVLHASLAGDEVMVSPDLQRYVENNEIQTGIVVARPVDPRTRPGK